MASSNTTPTEPDPPTAKTSTAPDASAASDVTGSREGVVSIRAAEAALMLGETAAYNSLKMAADEIARWINASTTLGNGAKILITSDTPLTDSLDYLLVLDQLAILETDAEYQQRANDKLLTLVQTPAPKSDATRQPGMEEHTGPDDASKAGGEVEASASILGALMSGLAAISPIATAGIAAIQATPALLSAVNSAAGFFRADYEVAGTRTTVSSDAVRVMVADQINDKHAVYFFAGSVMTQSDLLKRLAAVYSLAHKFLFEQRERITALCLSPLSAELRAAEAQLTRADETLKASQARWDALDQSRRAALEAGNSDDSLKSELDAAARQRDAQARERDKAQAKVNAAQSALGPMLAVVASTDAIIKRIDAWLVTIRDETSGGPKLGRALRHEWMTKTGITHLLQVNFVAAGHEIITEKGFIATLFGRQKMHLVGSGVMSYLLTDVTGRRIKSDTVARTSVMQYVLKDGKITLISTAKTT